MWAVLPLKDFARSKQRLAGLLDASQRGGLLEAMANDVLQTLSGHPDIEGTLVVSSDPAARRLARTYGAGFVSEAELGVSGLNPLVQAAVALLARHGIDEVLVLHGDLPLITVAEVSQLVQQHRSTPSPSLTLATDRHRDGSNGLLCQTANAPCFGYGKGSCQWHQEQAHLAGMTCTVLFLPGIGSDIDESGDLLAFLNHSNASAATHTGRYLAASGIARQLLAQENV